MTEEEARQWLNERFDVSRETSEKLTLLVSQTIAANEEQNLISRSTIDHIWARHIVDSAQLLPLAAERDGAWVDLGSGAGFPGLVVGLLSERPVTLIEVRRKRVEHLAKMIDLLNMKHRVTVVQTKVEQYRTQPFAVISARAYAPLDRLFETAHGLSDKKTLWVLPKGRSAASELEAACIKWQGRFRTVESVTDHEGAIIVADQVEPRRRR